MPNMYQCPMIPNQQYQMPSNVTPSPTNIPITPITPGPINIPATPLTPGSTGAPDFELEPGPPVKRDTNYTQGWLTTQIGKYIKIEFLIGTNMLIDREGVLMEVGISYIVIRESGTNDLLMCDIYSIKFVRIFNDQQKLMLCRE
ncbi:hypothetical protein HGG79_15705 [Clostridium tetanomorphum]|uniref:Uncharacterized protein n=2 Tax=Clostridium tetanomorphum TaxID=1553 RepID=A0A923J1G2_CLOTT|nr:hypothetical protein [Clostridium tetanomorphum]